MNGVKQVFRTGRFLGGWRCSDCHATYWHHGHPLRTYPRVVAHLAWRHHRLPVPGLTSAKVDAQ